MNLAQAKAALRREALARRADVDSRVREAFAVRLARQGVEFARRKRARAVSAYWPIATEADTRSLLRALAERAFATCLPAVVAAGQPLLFRRWQNGDPLVPGPKGTFEPAARSPEVEPTLLFVPVAAFDRRGHRLGYGAGHYDCTLSRLRIRAPILAVGVGFACQEVAAVPEEAHDQPLDYVMTETEMIVCSENGNGL